MNFIKNKFFKITLIQNTRIFFLKQALFISGPRGLVVYKKLINHSDFTFIVSKTSLECYKTANLSITKSPNMDTFLKLYNLLHTLIYNVHYFFSKKLVLIGVGIRAWVKYIEKEQKNILLIKLGFSKDLYIQIPQNLMVFSLRPTLLLIRGLNKEAVTLFSSYLKQLKKPDVYKGKGIQYKNELMILKPGKKS
jgi:large subunit ribosomal protein L6